MRTEDAFQELAAVIEDARPEAIQALAAELEAARAKAEPAAAPSFAQHHGFLDGALTTTAFELQVGLMACEAGVFAFDRAERYFMRPLPEELHPNVPRSAYTARLRHGALETPDHWPFRDDATVADFERGTSPRWWSHGLLHTMVGFAWWPAFTELELMATARFSETFAVWHWYWLCELGREKCPRHRRIMGVRIGFCPDCLELERSASLPAARLARIHSDEGRWYAEDGLTFIAAEVQALQAALLRGELELPEARVPFSIGDACEFTHWHHPRLHGRPFRRWLEACMRPGLDYADTPEAFAAHAAQLARRLLTFAPPAESPDLAARARRVLQDVAWRLCVDAEHAGAPDAFDPLLAQLSTTLDGLAEGDDAPEDALKSALEACVEARLQHIPDAEARAVFALGYRPTLEPEREPDAIARARAEAAREAFSTTHLPRGLLERVGAAASRPRVIGSWTRDLLVDAEGPWRDLLEWLAGISRFYDVDPHELHDRGWFYRLSLHALPAPERWPHYQVRRQPMLQEMGALYRARSLERFFRGELNEPPERYEVGERPAHVLLGPTPAGPVLEVIRGDLARLLRVADAGGSLADAIEVTSEAFVEQALARHLVACFEG